MTDERKNQTPQTPAGDVDKDPAGETSAADNAAGEPKKRLDPTRYGDWEKDGRCIDF